MRGVSTCFISSKKSRERKPQRTQRFLLFSLCSLCLCGFLSDPEFHRGAPFDQQRVTDCARPASLVSLYLLFMSFAAGARAITVSSKSMRCLEAIALLAIA